MRRVELAGDGSRRSIGVAAEHRDHFAAVATNYILQSDLRGREPRAVSGDSDWTSKILETCDISPGEGAPVPVERHDLNRFRGSPGIYKPAIIDGRAQSILLVVNLLGSRGVYVMS